MVNISSGDFEQLVEKALGELPPRFADLLENIVVIVEDEPPAHDLYLLPHPGSELLGVFRGIPMTHMAHNMTAAMPNQVAIFRGPILRVTHSREQAERQIRDTVIHELGHYFGLSDAAMVY